ncbi:MAG: c-type cytochrome [Anaerolineaceae bacterium]|nr:c-type cytochrome [Anaerolineaceae bacterium]
MSKFLFRIFVLPGLLLLMALSACSLAEDVTPPPGFVPTQSSTSEPVSLMLPSALPDLSYGATIYAEKCAACHGISGRGDGADAANLPVAPPAIGLADLSRAAKPVDWFKVVQNGQIDQGMPGFSGSLDSGQIWNVVSYTLSLSATQQQIQSGQTVYQQACQICHGITGAGSVAKAKINPLSDPAYQAQHSLQEFYQTLNRGVGADMPAYASLSEDQRWAVLAYVRTLAIKPNNDSAVAAAGGVSTQTPVAVGLATTPSTAVVGTLLTQPATAGSQSTPLAITPLAITPLAITGQAAILGKVVNSSSGQIPAGLKVTLQNTDGTKQTEIASGSVQSDGSYSFPNVPIVTGWTYLVSVKYNNQAFNSDLIRASDLQPGGQVTTVVNIYDSSTDASILSADRLHVILDFSNPGIMQVVELFIISNPTNRVIVPSQPGQPVLKFTLPAGASNLQFQDGVLGDRFVQTSDGFGDTQSVLPGSASHQVLFAYELPYQDGAALKLLVNLPVQTAMVMVPAGRIKVDSSQLVDTGQRSTQGVSLELYASGSLASGSSLFMTISNSTGGGLLGGGSTSLIIAVIIFLLAVLTGVALILRQRNNRSVLEAAVPSESNSGSRSDDTMDSLMDGIIALDDMYQDGELPEEAYLKRRKELKGRLRILSESQKKP